MHVSFLNNSELVRTLEVLVQKELGSERLFQHYIFMRLERKVLQFTSKEYCRCIRALADKQHSEDRQFWSIILKYVFEKDKPKGGERKFMPN